MIATPALAVDDFYGPNDQAKFDDSRRPDLGIKIVRGGDKTGFPEAGDSAWEEFYVSDMEIGAFLDRLYEVLTNEEWLGKYPEVAKIAEYMNESGIFDLERIHSEYAITGDRMYFMMQESFEDLDPESYYGKVLALPDGSLESAKYVNGDQLLYFAANNVPQMMMYYLTEVMRAVQMTEEVSESMELEADLQLGDLTQVFGMLEAFPIEETINSLLTGELAVVYYDLPPFEQLMLGDIQPADIEVAIMLGVQNLDGVLGMVEGFGDEIGLLEREYEGDPWHYYVMNGEETIGIMLNDEMAVLTSNIDVTRNNVLAALNNGGLELEPCQFYLDLNMAGLHQQLIDPASQMATQWVPEGVTLPVEPMSYLVNLPESDALGHLTMQAYFDEGYMCEIEMKKATLQYLAFYLGVGLCAAAQSGVFH